MPNYLEWWPNAKGRSPFSYDHFMKYTLLQKSNPYYLNYKLLGGKVQNSKEWLFFDNLFRQFDFCVKIISFHDLEIQNYQKHTGSFDQILHTLQTSTKNIFLIKNKVICVFLRFGHLSFFNRVFIICLQRFHRYFTYLTVQSIL